MHAVETPVMLHSMDPEWRLLSVSNHWLRTLGFAREEVVGRRFTEFLTQDSRRFAFETVLPEFARSGECSDVLCQMVCKDGRVIEVLMSAAAGSGDAGAPAVLIDVSDRSQAKGTQCHRASPPDRPQRGVRSDPDERDRRQLEMELQTSEARLQALADNSPMVIFMKDLEGRYLMVNREFERNHRISNAEIRGKTAFDIFPADEAEVYAAHDRAALDSRAATRKEMAFDGPGGPRSLSVVKFPVFDSDGGLIGLGGLEFDITEIRRAEKAVRESERRFRSIADMIPALIWMSASWRPLSTPSTIFTPSRTSSRTLLAGCMNIS